MAKFLSDIASRKLIKLTNYKQVLLLALFVVILIVGIDDAIRSGIRLLDVTRVIAVLFGSVLVAPVGEEVLKNIFYRKLTFKNGLIIAVAIQILESLFYATFYGGIDLGTIINRLINGGHIMLFFVASYWNFRLEGIIIATGLHSIWNFGIWLDRFPPNIYSASSEYVTLVLSAVLIIGGIISLKSLIKNFKYLRR